MELVSFFSKLLAVLFSNQREKTPSFDQEGLPFFLLKNEIERMILLF